MNQDKFAAHLQVDRYGDFWLTRAVRPSPALDVVPRQGFRVDTYRDPSRRFEVPVLAAAVSREHLFDVFLGLMEPLGDVVDVVLETSHHNPDGRHRDRYREGIDRPVLASHLCEFENLLLHDGCTGIAVIATEQPIELQFDEHKLLIVYARDLRPFRAVLRSAGIEQADGLKLITEGEHLHNSDTDCAEAFQRLCYRLGVGEAAERVSW